MMQLTFRSQRCCGPAARAHAPACAARIAAPCASLPLPRPASSSSRNARLRCCALLTQRPENIPSLQLGTAAVPRNASVPVLVDSLYQWAATMSQSGANYPTILPLKVDKLENGFQIGLMKRLPGPAGGIGSAGDIQVTVEDVESPKTKQGLFIRFYEGPAAQVDRRGPPSSNPQERLETVLASLVDVDTIMQTMPNAIRQAAAKATAAGANA